MSYCRFSTNDFQCDVYVYGDTMGGWTTHVAGSRYVFNEPLPPHIENIRDNIEAFVKREQEVMRIVEKASFERIDLPLAGESFFNLDRDSTVAKLCELRDLGYKFPYEIIQEIQEEDEE